MTQTQPVVVHESDVAVEAWRDDVRGELTFRTLLGDGHRPTTSISAGVAYREPGEWLGLHRHLATAICYLLAGEATMTLDGVDHAVRAGHAVFVPGNTEHAIRNIGAETVQFFYAFDVDTFDEVRYQFPGNEPTETQTWFKEPRVQVRRNS